MLNVLVIGQTPPPYGGQALMIKYLLDSRSDDINLYHVRMNFSREFDDRGKFSLYKILHVFEIIWKVWNIRFKHHTKVLYYPISSTPKIAVLRDCVILLFTRFLFKKVVFHFHAAGISEELPKYNGILKWFVYRILCKPDIAITSSRHNPKDAEFLQANEIKIIPLGIPDENFSEARKEYTNNSYLTVLFVGLLNSTKGEGYLLDAIYQLNSKGLDFRFNIAGKFESENYKTNFFSQVDKYNLSDKVKYFGIVTGEDKRKLFLDSDIFCFPSYFSSESFGVVLLEAMMYQMPLIGTKWRGIQSLIEEDSNGYLVDIKNSEQIAEYLMNFYLDRTLVEKMGRKSRNIFLQKYTLSEYIENITKTFVNL